MLLRVGSKLDFPDAIRLQIEPECLNEMERYGFIILQFGLQQHKAILVLFIVWRKRGSAELIIIPSQKRKKKRNNISCEPIFTHLAEIDIGHTQIMIHLFQIRLEKLQKHDLVLYFMKKTKKILVISD